MLSADVNNLSCCTAPWFSSAQPFSLVNPLAAVTFCSLEGAKAVRLHLDSVLGSSHTASNKLLSPLPKISGRQTGLGVKRAWFLSKMCL